jgi:hypothetical protein
MWSLTTLDFIGHRPSALASNWGHSVYKTFLIIYSHSYRYSVNVRKCQGDTGTTGNLFVIAFTFGDQPGCRTASCRQQFLTNFYSNIETIYRNINLPITFTNGQTLNVELIFCSFGFSQNSRNLYIVCRYIQERTN